MFAITGTSLSAIRWINNGGKKARYSLDRWDRVRAPSWHVLRRAER
ncbi:MAG: hypothetical protein INR71_02085 [Terriglobus roseus]|nr:hypothetical protein [Terriglobus roseus]